MAVVRPKSNQKQRTSRGSMLQVTSQLPDYTPFSKVVKSGIIHPNTLDVEIKVRIAQGGSPEELPFVWLKTGKDGRGKVLLENDFVNKLHEQVERLEEMARNDKIIPLNGLAEKIEKELDLKPGTVEEGTIRWWLFHTALSEGRRVLKGKTYITSDVLDMIESIYRYMHVDTVTRNRAFRMLGKKSSGGYQKGGNRRIIDRWIEEGLLQLQRNEHYDAIRRDPTSRLDREIIEKIVEFERTHCKPVKAAKIAGVDRGVIERRLKNNWTKQGKLEGVEHALGRSAYAQTTAFLPIGLARLIARERSIGKNNINQAIEIAKRKYVAITREIAKIEQAYMTLSDACNAMRISKDLTLKAIKEGLIPPIERHSMARYASKDEIFIERYFIKKVNDARRKNPKGSPFGWLETARKDWFTYEKSRGKTTRKSKLIKQSRYLDHLTAKHHSIVMKINKTHADIDELNEKIKFLKLYGATDSELKTLETKREQLIAKGDELTHEANNSNKEIMKIRRFLGLDD